MRTEHILTFDQHASQVCGKLQQTSMLTDEMQIFTESKGGKVSKSNGVTEQ